MEPKPQWLIEIEDRLQAGEQSAVVRGLLDLHKQLEANSEADRLRMAQIDQRSRQGYLDLNQRTWLIFAVVGVLAALVWRLDLTTDQGAAIANTLIEQAAAIAPVIVPLLAGAGYMVSRKEES